MGREIRRVPPHWEHPKVQDYKGERYQPMFDRSYRQAMDEWIENDTLWKQGKHPDIADAVEEGCFHYAQWNGNPPDVNYYRPDWDKELCTWYQLYETVSEGTPVSPPFETQEELIDYLAKHGDFWDQKRRKEGDSIMNCDPWGYEQARAFVMGPGWAPSGAIVNGQAMSGVEFVAQTSVETP